jgi:exopolysaccharide biosynthesis predicted pyruvyltransferase EpsI
MYGTDNEEVGFYTCHRLLSFMRQWDEIKTNRLHLGIAGALLGEKVKFYGNNYYKCKAIYQYSMKNRFPNVQWIG